MLQTDLNMGLFGGFKAKFTKDSTAKSSTSVKKSEVVCLGYRVYSEFDNPPQYVQNASKPNRKPSAIRTVIPRPKSDTSSGEFNASQPSTSIPIETQIVTNPKVKKNSKKKAPDAKNKHLSTPNLMSTSNISEERPNLEHENSATNVSSINIALGTTEPVKLRNGGVKEESRSAPSSIYVTGKTSSFNPNLDEISSSTHSTNSAEVTIKEVSPKAPKSILKYKPSVHNENLGDQNSNTIENSNNNIVLASDENIYSDTEYDRTLAQVSSKTNKSDGYTTKTVDYMSATKAVNERYSTQVTTYVHTEVSNSTTDATINNNNANSNVYYTGGYNYNQNTRIGNTSNHAANIFFGGDEEPEVQRPRKANLAVLQSEEDRRSSAEC